tara:strand:- start:229 stop:450 length:222 start_codon:yes stop_codon:yes gene_type:complete
MHQSEDDKPFLLLLREQIADWTVQYFEWLKFRPNQNFFEKLLHILTRTIASIFVIAFSPIVFIILLVTFFAAG